MQGAADIGDDGAGAPTEPLQQGARQNTARLAGQLTGQLGHFVWGATGSYVHIGSRSSSGIGLDAAGDTLIDRTDSALNAGNLQLSLSGPVAVLPAGLVVANAKFGFQYQGFDTEDAYPGSAQTRSNLIRTVRSGSFNASVPIASRDRGVLPKLGELSGTINVALDNVSNFGTLWSSSYGLDWVAVERVHLDAIFTDHETAPTVQQVQAPPVYTPNVEMYDFVTGETVYVTAISGGTGNLRATDDRVASFGLSLGPFLGKTVFSAHYEQNRIRDAIGALPPLTTDVELAFPERFVRGAGGSLLEIDNRWINLQHQNLDDLKWGLQPLGAIGLGAGGARRARPGRIVRVRHLVPARRHLDPQRRAAARSAERRPFRCHRRSTAAQSGNARAHLQGRLRSRSERDLAKRNGGGQRRSHDPRHPVLLGARHRGPEDVHGLRAALADARAELGQGRARLVGGTQPVRPPANGARLDRRNTRRIFSRLLGCARPYRLVHGTQGVLAHGLGRVIVSRPGEWR